MRARQGDVRTNLDAAIVIDPDVHIDTLPNGVTTYVRANPAPEHRAEVRLVVNAGSVLEDDDQRGLAHAVEHMAFRGTRRFPGNRTTEFMQRMGMRTGVDLNASTSFDETTYSLTIPTDSSSNAALDTAIAILADWAHAVEFDSVQAVHEAGVVFEEWRAKTVVGRRLAQSIDTLLFSGSRYAQRFPIGDTLVLRRFDLAAMRRFYQRWYRPDLMAVIAVGDFDPEQVQSLIQTHFSAIPRSSNPAPRPSHSIAFARSARAAVFADPEATGTRVSLWFPRAVRRPANVSDFRNVLTERISRAILNDRLMAASRAPDTPILNANITLRSVVRPAEAHVVSAAVLAPTVTDAVGALTEEVARLARYGVTVAELERAKEKELEDRRHDEAYLDRSDFLADSYVWHFLLGETIAGRENDLKLANALVPTIGAHDVQRVALQWSLDSSATIVVTTRPLGVAPLSLDTATLVESARSAATRAADTRRDTVAIPELLTPPHAPGEIAQERFLREPDVFEWTLANGMRVLLKPTRFVDGQILMRLTAPGGASLASKSAYPSAFYADGVLLTTGIGTLPGSDLSRLLESKSATFQPTVTDYGIELAGDADSGDMELVFQLAHLFLTTTRFDTTAFLRHQARSVAIAENRQADPNSAFEDSVAKALLRDDPRALANSPGFVQRVTMRDALAFWQARVKNASNFTMVLVGDFSLDGARTLVRQYLAPLPAGRRETPGPPIASAPASVLERSFLRGTLPKARTQIAFTGSVQLTPAREVALRALRDLLALTLEDQLREQSGGTYSVDVNLTLHPTSLSPYELSIDFEAAPERIDSLASQVLNEVRRLCDTGATEDEVSKVVAAEVRDADAEAKSNFYWASELEWRAQLGWPLEAASAHRALVSELSSVSLRQACQQYLSLDRYVRVTMRPRQ